MARWLAKIAPTLTGIEVGKRNDTCPWTSIPVLTHMLRHWSLSRMNKLWLFHDYAIDSFEAGPWFFSPTLFCIVSALSEDWQICAASPNEQFPKSNKCFQKFILATFTLSLMIPAFKKDPSAHRSQVGIFSRIPVRTSQFPISSQLVISFLFCKFAL